jgi:hypothetical protein
MAIKANSSREYFSLEFLYGGKAAPMPLVVPAMTWELFC